MTKVGMARKSPSAKRYVVRLEPEERERLEGRLPRGKHRAQVLTKARILLQADVSEAGGGWSDRRIIEALGTNASTLHRRRKQLVEDGLDAVLSASRGRLRQWARSSTVRRRCG
jgi:hypothetical protein